MKIIKLERFAYANSESNNRIYLALLISEIQRRMQQRVRVPKITKKFLFQNSIKKPGN